MSKYDGPSDRTITLKLRPWEIVYYLRDDVAIYDEKIDRADREIAALTAAGMPVSHWEKHRHDMAALRHSTAVALDRARARWPEGVDHGARFQ